MQLEPGLVAYAALATLSLTQNKHRPHRSDRLIPTRGAAKPLGIALLFLSVLSAWLLQGPALGSVIWFAQTSIAAVALVLLLSWKPPLAFFLARFAAIIGVVGAIV
ncbi:MAG: hypothetical protein DI606_09560 [Sphingobium sp.]|uniref:DUF3325 family protein n=1 Tax=Sphingobium sp. TaxID=1912891 RepID=UPI000DB8B9F4|nr:DUF3325 family protein [Sphingobium sp.]PZU12322.1 MAG: hypothetical protein DI606_09560 [Sphingobium sp.]